MTHMVTNKKYTYKNAFILIKYLNWKKAHYSFGFGLDVRLEN